MLTRNTNKPTNQSEKKDSNKKSTDDNETSSISVSSDREEEINLLKSQLGAMQQQFNIFQNLISKLVQEKEEERINISDDPRAEAMGEPLNDLRVKNISLS